MDNLDRMVAAIQEQGAMVVLMEIKMGLFDQYLPGFKKLARKRNVYKKGCLTLALAKRFIF